MTDPGRAPARLAPHAKRQPFAHGYLAALTAVTAGLAVPDTEEFMRCFRADRTLVAHPSPVHPPQEAAV